MADNQRTRYAGRDAPFLSDGDPLAELARIAGYETRTADEEPSDHGAASGDEFDLEAELMRSIGAAEEPEAPAGTAAQAEELATDDIPAFLKARPTHDEDAAGPIDADPVPDAAALPPEPAADVVSVAPEDAVAEPEPVEAEPDDPFAAFDEALSAELEAAAAEPAETPAADETDASPVPAVDEAPEQAFEAYSEFEAEEARFDNDIVRSFDDDLEIPASRPEPVALADVEENFAGDVPASQALGRAVPASSLTDFAQLDETSEDAVWRDMVRYALPVHGAVSDVRAEPAALQPGAQPGETEPPQAVAEEPIATEDAAEPAEEESPFEPMLDEAPAAGSADATILAEDAVEPFAAEQPVEEPSATQTATTATADDPWDIADEIEAAFADFGLARSKAPAAAPIPVVQNEPEFAAPESVAVVEPETAEPFAEAAGGEIGRIVPGEGEPVEAEPAGTVEDIPADAFEPAAAELPEPYAAAVPDDGAAEGGAAPEAAAFDADDLPEITFDFDDFEMEMQTGAADEVVAGTAELAPLPQPEQQPEPETTMPDPETLRREPEVAAPEMAEPHPDEPAPDAAPSAAAAAPVAAAAASAIVVPLHVPRRPVIQRYESEPVPFRPAASAPVRPAFERDVPGDLAFDVHDVSDTSDVIEPVREIEVPDLPEDEELPRADAGDDFDLADLEAEFADILARNETEDRRQAEPVEAAPAAAAAASVVTPLAAHRANGALPAGGQIDFAEYDFSGMAEQDHAGAEGGIDDAITFDGGEGAAPERAQRAASKRRAPWMVGVAAVAVIAAAGLSAYAFFGGGPAGSDGPRIIAASDEPIKVAPADPGGRSVPNQDQAVYDQVSGAGATGEDVNLISRAEEPVDVVQRTVDPMVLPLEGRATGEPTPPVTEETDAAAAAPAGDDAAPDGLRGAMTESEPLGIAPRIVQTSVVRPDGTLVPAEPASEPAAAPAEQSGAAAVAAVDGEEALAASRMIAAAEAGTDLADGTGQLPSAQAEGATETAAAAPGVPLPQPRPEEQAALAADPEARLTPDGASAQDALAAPVRTVRTTTLTPDTQPTPGDRPADQPVNIVGQTAPAAEAPTETAAATGAAFDNPGGYVVQIASQPSQESAQATYDSLASRFGSVIGGLPVQIQSAEIPDRGTFYRVRVAGGTREEAVALCERYQAAGGSCFVAR